MLTSPTQAPQEPTTPLRACLACGLTLVELHTDGRMGCEQCYKTFTPEVEQAMRLLQGVEPPSDNPWPTRRAKTISQD